MPALLNVSTFGGGVVRLGSPDTQKVDELLQADSLDIGPRGALIAASDATDYVVLEDGAAVPLPWTALHALLSAVPGFRPGELLAVGEGVGQTGGGEPFGPAYLVGVLHRQGDATPVVLSKVLYTSAWVPLNPPELPAPEGPVVVGQTWPGMFEIIAPGFETNIALFCLGAREGFAPNSNVLFGLWVAWREVGALGFGCSQIGQFDALGTGTFGELPVGGGAAGTNAQQLFFRGMIPYNNHVFGWGFDSADATNGDGPNRVMFCNLGLPLKWGNDNQAAVGTDRLFTDSDAIVLGDAGEIIRGGLVWSGKLWLFTNKQGHWIGGYGRDSFLTDGATPAVKSQNVVGPHALIEGPDKAMYGVGDQGLWRTADGSTFETVGEKLIDFDGHSLDWWDLIWTDPAAPVDTYPGRTNQDLVWMAVDWTLHQVLIGIPFCDAGRGYGSGLDTVVIRYHTRTAGFTRQVFEDVQYTAVGYFRREGQQPETKFLGTATAGEATIQRYGYKLVATDSPILPTLLPVAEFGPYAPFGPDGEGTIRALYLTIAWESQDSLPLVFSVQTTVDTRVIETFTLTISPIAPAAPVVGDLWLDTSQTDASLGNATAGAAIPARGGYLLSVYQPGRWLRADIVTATGTRAMLILALQRQRGLRVTIRVACVAAAGRFQIEGLGLNPGGGSPQA